MENEFDFDLDLDIDPSLDPAAPAPKPGKPAKPVKPAKPKKSGGFPKWIIAVAAAVVVLVGVGFGVRALGSGRSESSPLDRTMKGLESNETVAFLRDAARNGTLQVDVGLKQLTNVDGAVSLTVASDCRDLKNARAQLNAALTLKKREAADVTLYADSKQLVLSSDVLLGSKALGVDLSQLRARLPDSIFDPDSDTDFALDEALFDTLMNLDPAAAGKNADQLTKQAQAVYNSAMKMLGKSVKAHADKAKTADTLRFDDQSVKVSIVTYTADAEAVHAIALDVLRWAQDSKELRALLELVEDEYGDLLDADWLDELDETLEDAIARLEEEREDFLDDHEDMELALSLYLSKSKGEILGLKLKVEDGNDSQKAEVFWGPSMAQLNSISFKYDNGNIRYSGSYTVKTNDKERFEAALKLRQDGEAVLDGSFRWDKTDGGYTLKLADVVVKGTMEKLSDGFQATVTRLTVNGNEQKLDVTVTLRKSAKLGNPPSYRELVTMDEDDLEELGEDLVDALYDLLDENDELYNILYLFYPWMYGW